MAETGLFPPPGPENEGGLESRYFQDHFLFNQG
jgi:hypothetical protein